jgi:hypothetical protein
MRSDLQLTRSVFLADVASSLGISGKLARLFGGHRLHAVIASTLYALLFAVALPLEMAYEFDRYRRPAIEFAVLILAGILLTTFGGLLLDWRFALRGRHTGLAVSIGTATLSALVLYIALRPILPAHAITQATFQTYTAQTAYLKSIFYYVPFAIIFLFLPFHFVLRMQVEFRAGRHDLGLQLLAGRDPSLALPPRGTIFLRPWVLGSLLVLGTVVSILMAGHLLDNLKPGPHTNLFIHLLQIRWCLYLLLGLECLTWYYLALNDLKREAIAIERIQGVHTNH